LNLIEQYNELRPQYLSFTEKLKKLLEDLLGELAVDYHLIESRAKEIKSFEEKIKRKEGAYKDIIDITDLSGIRIIVYYNDDIKKIVDLISAEFEIDSANSLIKGNEYNPNEFGYLSSHIVCKIGKSRKNLAEWKKFSAFKTEIQIRTVLQHSWASISHTLQYKTKQDIPEVLQRKLFRLAGLFELADEQFTGIRDDHRRLSEDIKSEDISKSDRELNLLSIERYIETSEVVKEIYSSAIRLGYIDNDSASDDLDIDKDESRTLSHLITFCDRYQIKTIKQLDEILKSLPKREIEDYLNYQLVSERNISTDWFVSPAFVIILIIIYLFKNEMDNKFLVKNGWGESTSKRIIKHARLFEKATSS
jgi:putative GTP pyrophosphokinase